MTQHHGWARSRVGWTIPVTHAQTNSLRIEHPIRTLTCRAGSRAGRVGLLVLRAIAASLNDDRIPVMHQPAEQGPGHSAVPLRDGRPSLEAADSCRIRMDRRRDSERPYRTTSAPPSSISRWSNFTGAKLGYNNATTIINRADDRTSGASKNVDKSLGAWPTSTNRS